VVQLTDGLSVCGAQVDGVLRGLRVELKFIL
jgi:hypothetical protein